MNAKVCVYIYFPQSDTRIVIRYKIWIDTTLVQSICHSSWATGTNRLHNIITTIIRGGGRHDTPNVLCSCHTSQQKWNLACYFFLCLLLVFCCCRMRLDYAQLSSFLPQQRLKWAFRINPLYNSVVVAHVVFVVRWCCCCCCFCCRCCYWTAVDCLTWLKSASARTFIFAITRIEADGSSLLCRENVQPG